MYTKKWQYCFSLSFAGKHLTHVTIINLQNEEQRIGLIWMWIELNWIELRKMNCEHLWQQSMLNYSKMGINASHAQVSQMIVYKW